MNANMSLGTTVTTVLFDLVDTLVEETEESASLRYQTQVKAIYESLGNDGIVVDWHLFEKEYMEARRRQLAASEETLREYDMAQRVTNVLSLFSISVSPTSACVPKALDIYMDLWINTLTVKETTTASLAELAKNYRLGLVTNFAHIPGANRTIDRFRLRPYFQTILISGEFGWKKPSPRIFEAALHNLSSKPEETVFVGDNCKDDITGAKQMGMRTVFLQRKDAKCSFADITVKSIAELPSVVRQL